MPLNAENSTSMIPQATGPSVPTVPLLTPAPRPTSSGDSPQPIVSCGVETKDSADKTAVWGVRFDCVTMTQALNRIGELVAARTPSYVITANLNYVMLHHRCPDLSKVTEDAAVILADGQPIVWRSRWTSAPLPERVAGSEMIYRLAEIARNQGWSIYFLGGASGVASACARKLVELYPGLRIAGAESPPFRPLSPDEQREQDQRIIGSGADLLLVAFGQPKGERWIHEHHRRLGVPVSIQLGASFDFVAGTSSRAPRVWQRLGMEWAYRMLSDPERLIPRYSANARFLLSALLHDLTGQRWT